MQQYADIYLLQSHSTCFERPDLAALDPYITTYTQPINTFHKTRSHQS